MNRLKPGVDIVLELLHAVRAARPEDTFIQSLLQQYLERGGLSKKQLMGLRGKAEKVRGIPDARLATLDAIIKKKVQKDRTAPSAPQPLYREDPETQRLIDSILSAYPAHKRVLFLQAKFRNHEPLNTLEMDELRKFSRLPGVSRD